MTMITVGLKRFSRGLAPVVVAGVVLAGCAENTPAPPSGPQPTTAASTSAVGTTTATNSPHIGADGIMFYNAGPDDTVATIGVTGPGRDAAATLATMPGNSYDKLVRYHHGFVAVGTKGLLLLDKAGNTTGSLEIPGLNTVTGWTTSVSGERTAIALNTGSGRFPDAQTIVSLSDDPTRNYSVSTHSYPAALTQCDDGTLKWLEPAPGQPPVDAASPVALDLVTATTPEQVKRVHLPAVPYPVSGRIDCASNTASYLALSNNSDSSTAVVITNPGPQATIHRQPIDAAVHSTDSTGASRTSTAFADRHGGMYQFGMDGKLESWWFSPQGVVHDSTDTGFGGTDIAGVSFTGGQAIVWRDVDGPAVTVTAIDVAHPQCHSAPVTVPVLGTGEQITSMVPVQPLHIDCDQQNDRSR